MCKINNRVSDIDYMPYRNFNRRFFSSQYSRDLAFGGGADAKRRIITTNTRPHQIQEVRARTQTQHFFSQSQRKAPEEKV